MCSANVSQFLSYIACCRDACSHLTQMSEGLQMRGHVHPEHIVSLLTTLQGPSIPAQDLPGAFPPGLPLTNGQ